LALGGTFWYRRRQRSEGYKWILFDGVEEVHRGAAGVGRELTHVGPKVQLQQQ